MYYMCDETKFGFVSNDYKNYYNNLPKRELDRALSKLPLNKMCKLATSSKRFETACFDIWSRTPLYQNNIDNQFQLSDDDYRYYICKNAKNFTALQMYSGDFESFDNATRNLKLNNLTTLRLIMDYNSGKPLSTDFLNRCNHLEVLRLCRPSKKFAMHNIFKFKNLKLLEICHEHYEINEFIKKLIERKGHSIIRIQTHTEVFPPRWLKASVTDKCHNLQDLALGSRINLMDTKDNKWTLGSLPNLKKLKNLWIIGLGFPINCVMAFVEKCCNLENFYYDNIEECEIYIHDILRKRTTKGNDTPLNLIKYSGITENTTFIEFK